MLLKQVNKRKKRILVAILCLGLLAGCSGEREGNIGDTNLATGEANPMIEDSEAAGRQEVGIRIDFSTVDTQKPPHSQKYGQFTPTWEMGTSRKISRAAAELLPQAAALGAESFRVDLFMGLDGGIGGRIGNGWNDAGDDARDYTAIAEISEKLIENGMSPYYVYYANPVYCGGGPEADRWKNPPDMEKWQELCFHISSYFSERNIRLGGHEIWNEPDWGTAFFDGSWEDYIATYLYGVKGIRAANPDAVVGGLSSAEIHKLYANGRAKLFLDKVLEEKAPLDFISWHYYGRNGRLDGKNPFQEYIAAARGLLEQYPEYSTLQQHLNEFNLFEPGADLIYRTYQMVPYIFKAIERLNQATDITRVFWASTIGSGEPGCNLINRADGERYPAYRALWCYARLPQARAAAEVVKAPGVKVMAGKSWERAGVIFYNTSVVSKKVTVSLEGLAEEKGEMSVYMLDEAYQPNLESDFPVLLETIEVSGDMEYSMEIGRNGAVYLEINYPPEEWLGRADITEKLIRKDYWYPQRGDNCAGADFYERSSGGYLWTGSTEDGQGCGVAITLENMQGENWRMEYRVSGEVKKASGESCLGLKVDYHTKGGYAKSIFFPLRELGALPELPWNKEAEVTMPQQAWEGSIGISFSREAPADWDGRVMLQWIANACGRGVYVEYQLYQDTQNLTSDFK